MKTIADALLVIARAGDSLLPVRNAFHPLHTIGQIHKHFLLAAFPVAFVETSVHAIGFLHRPFAGVDRHAVVRAVVVLQQLMESPLRFSMASTLTALAYLSGLFAGKSELYSVRSPQLQIETSTRNRSQDDAQG